MSATMDTQLHALCETLGLEKPDVGESQLRWRDPDGAALECIASDDQLRLGYRASVAARHETAIEVLTAFLARLTQRDGLVRWELREPRKDSMLEIWLVADLEQGETTALAGRIRARKAEMSRLARRERPVIQAIAQPRVAAILGESCGT